MRRFALAVLIALLPCRAWTGTAEDAAITSRVETTFLLNEHLSMLNIKTDTKDGVVTLTGTVREESQRQLAEDLARQAKNVKDVKNNLVVVPGKVGEKERRSFRQKMNDRGVEAAVRSRLLYHRQFKGLRINAESVNNVVTLYGVVPTEALRDAAGKIAMETKGVNEVINMIVVRPKEEASTGKKIKRTFSDEWLESRVEAAIVFNKALSIREIDVEVDDGVCILTGVVNSEEEKDAAAKIAESIAGIDAVRNEIAVRPGYVPARPHAQPPAPQEGKVEAIEPPEDTPNVETRPLDAP